MTKRFIFLASLALLAGTTTAHARPHAKMVAYDAKDRRFYSVAWARAHGMHDKGGDPLVIVRKSLLPSDAKESRAMQGHKI